MPIIISASGYRRRVSWYRNRLAPNAMPIGSKIGSRRIGTLALSSRRIVSSRLSKSSGVSGIATTSVPQSAAASRLVELTDSTNDAPCRQARSASQVSKVSTEQTISASVNRRNASAMSRHRDAGSQPMSTTSAPSATNRFASRTSSSPLNRGA